MRILSVFTLSLPFFVMTVNSETFTECEGTTESYVSSLKGCEYFITCNGADSTEAMCTDGTKFNPLEHACDDPSNFVCDTPSTTPPTTSISTTESQTTATSTAISETTFTPTTSPGTPTICPASMNPGEQIYLPDPESCTDYYVCFNSQAIKLSCENELEFNSVTGSCDWAQVSNCRNISPKQKCTLQFSGYFAYPNDCHYYYRCIQGSLDSLKCPIGLSWDVNRGMCTTMGCPTLKIAI